LSDHRIARGPRMIKKRIRGIRKRIFIVFVILIVYRIVGSILL
jgi:preprotein translocase subunit SecY